MKWDRSQFTIASLLVFACGIACLAEERLVATTAVAEISITDFQRLSDEIKPQDGESPWREINWLTNVTEARRQAAAEGKPIIIFTAADGNPLGRT